MISVQKKSNVPLEEAIAIAGGGLYTNYVSFTTGTIFFCAVMSLEGVAVVIPEIGCDLNLTDGEKGAIAALPFVGMLFSGQFFGFLADTFGRRLIIICSQIGTAILLIGCSFAPGLYTIMLMLFTNGFILTGAITPAYVYVSEFNSAKTRSEAMIAITAIGALANIYLPGMAWLIMPLNINLPIFDLLTFNSWRLYLIHLTIPIALSIFLLWKLPETPKFLLSQGKGEETLEVLKSMFAVNNKKEREEYPVLSVCLDANDEACRKTDDRSNQFVAYFKMMMQQTYELFTKKYAKYTLLSCAILIGVLGVYNTVFLWIPDQTSRIRIYSGSKGVYNVTLCYIMSSGNTNIEKVEDCQLDYNFFLVTIILGIIQFLTCLMSTSIAQKMGGKLFLILGVCISAGACFIILFLTNEYAIIVALVVMALLLYLVFPVVLSIMVEFFPTPLRSTATSIAMLFGRLGVAAGAQLMGILYAEYCRQAYSGMTLLLLVTVILCILMPSRNRMSQAL